MKLFVFFNKPTEDCHQFISSQDAVLIWQNQCTFKISANIFEVIDFNVDLCTLSESVKFFFKNNFDNRICTLEPYANNFYECTLIPQIKYIKTMEYILNSMNVNEIVFEKKIYFCTSQPNYFLGEHESHKMLLYSRASSFQPYLEQIAKSRGLTISYLYRSKIDLQYFANKLRLASVYLGKFCVDFKRIVVRNKVKKYNYSVKYIFNVRNYSQFEFISHLLSANDSFLISIYAGFYSHDLKNLLKTLPVTLKERVIFYANYSFFEFFCIYFKNFYQIISLPNQYIVYDGIKINITQAIKECLTMASELSLYSLSLNNMLKMTPKQQTSIFFSTEQKSPHAMVDASIGIYNNCKVVHLMQCDQYSIPLPNPVPGDLYVVDTHSTYHNFCQVFSNSSNKLAFVGNIKSLPFNNLISSKDKLKKYIICYFANVDDHPLNHKILNKLLDLYEPDKIIVKLHPRDSGKWLNNAIVRVIAHGELTFNDLFSLFEIALSGPSGIVGDLIGKSKPVVILNLKQELDIIQHYALPPAYKNIIYEFDQLKAILSNINSIKNEFKRISALKSFNEEFTAADVIKKIEQKLFTLERI